MNENRTKRKEWVKTAAIIFLSVLLVLTFFSNTIMNYSLPEVAAQYVEPGTITAKIRGSGVIESGDPYEVNVLETRKIQSVAVREGDKVEKGDVILYLEDTESDELKAAREALETALDAYDVALLSADVNHGVIQNAGSNTSTTSYRQQITDAQNAVVAEQKNVDDWQKKYDDISAKITTLPSNTADIEKETKAYNEAKIAKDNAENLKAEIENNIAVIDYMLANDFIINDGVTGGDAYNQLIEQREEQEIKLNNAEIAVAKATRAYTNAEKALNEKTAGGDTTDNKSSLESQKRNIEVKKAAAEKVLEEKKKALEDLTADINKTLNLQNLYETVVKAQEEVDKQLEKSQNATVTAGIAGTVTTLNVTAGNTTSPTEPVAVLQPEGKGYTMSFSVTNEQAKRLSVGDVAELINSWRYDEVEVTLTSIKPDKTDPGQKKMLTFDVSGEIMAGQTLNISVGQKSADYDLIVPNSAIREDNNGKFILIVETKNSPLGNRFVATRVDVQVLASDDTKSAISGALYGYEFVITTSTQPVEAGQLVRLAEN